MPAPFADDDPQIFDLARARAEVLAWLHEEGGDAAGSAGDGDLADKFLRRVADFGFKLAIVNLGSDEHPAFDPRWTYRENQFVGFKQPQSTTNEAEARLLACAALLRNDWCRARFPEGSGQTSIA